MSAGFAAALLAPDAPTPAGLRAWNGSDPARRFAVYRNNVVVSLIEALASAFPVTCELVGDAFFRAMARDFALAHPPRTRIMAQYGEAFPAFVAAFEPARHLSFLGDVAALEIARVSAYHAADAAPMSAEAFAALAPGDLDAQRFTPHPSLRVLRSRHAIFSIWAAHQGQGDLADVDPDAAEDALVVRPHLDVETTLLPPGAATFIATLALGATLGEAAASAFEDVDQFDLAGGLALALRSGAFVGPHKTGETP